MTLNCLKIFILQKYQLVVSNSTLSRILKQNNITYKKARKILEITPTIEKARQDLKGQANTIGFGNILCLDEVGFQLDMRRTNGWSDKGNRCYTTSKKIQRTNYHCIFLINNDKDVTFEIYDTPINTDIYVSFIKKLTPSNRTILLDNLRIHHSKKAVHEMSQKFSNILWTPPYSPESNQIEMNFSSLKAYTRRNRVTTKKELYAAIQAHIHTLQSGDLNRYYKHSWS
jgi:transposase